MSKYTTEVRFICETYAGANESNSNVEEMIRLSRGKIFDFDYPIFDEQYRSVLETKILRHYYTREICAETVGLWKHFLNRTLNEIMPYYNQLYKSTLLEFNPLYDVDVTTKHEGSGNSSSEGGSTSVLEQVNTNEGNIDSDNTKLDKYSDTPQGDVTGIESNKYLTNARKVTDDNTTHTNGTDTIDATSTNTNNATMTSTDQYLETIKGKRGGENISDMLMKYRKTFLNIDVDVINALSDCFFTLY